MSFVFEINGETVWSPALRVGQAFVGCAQALGEVVSVRPGFSFNAEDMIEIDPSQLELFAEALTRLLDMPKPHKVLSNLTDGVRIPCLVMLHRAGRDLQLGADVNVQLINEVGAVMPR